jgi:cystathionine beta-lyase/cystathionine gamma-synthase
MAVHAGEPRPRISDAITMPVFMSSTFVLGDPESFDDIRYIRLNNTPNHDALAQKLAALEGAEDALVTASGTAAISLSLLAFLEAGDHVIAPERIYGGTRKILDMMASRYRVEVTYVPIEEPARWASALRETTRVFYCESITNPHLEVGPLEAVVAFAREHGLVTMTDNTLATPVCFRPIEMGFDLVLHSASKYLNGHSDIVAGAVAGSAAHVGRVRKMANLQGVCLDPHACYMLHRGLKTLPVRMRAHLAGAERLARFLDAHDSVERVYFPGLEGAKSFARASAWFDGFGAMITFVPRGGVDVAEALLHELELAEIAPSMGGVETLVCRPATTSHAGLPDSLRLAMGVTDSMVRVSVGLEDPEDLCEDFARALERAGARRTNQRPHPVYES